MVVESRKYIKVSAIETPGNYVFASDPAHPGEKQYYDGSLSGDNIIGVRPDFEYCIDYRFHEKYPDLRVSELPRGVNIDQIEKLARRRYPFGVKGFNSLSHESTKPSILTVNGEYYRFACHLQFWYMHPKVVKFSLKDNARSNIPTQTRDGKLELEARECIFEKVGSDDLFWRGSLKLRGKHQGSLISDALECVNRNIRSFKIPTWQVI